MNEAFSKFRESLGNLARGAERSGVELLLQLVDRDTATLLRLCAVPHEFSPSILPILSPGMTQTVAEERYEKLIGFPFVSIGTTEASMHDQVRRELFALWLTEGHRETFVAVSDSLVRHFDGLLPTATGWVREQLARKRMFHLIGADTPKGFEEFERLCRQARYQFRFSDCHALIRLVHEYDTILTNDLRSRLAYHEGKLAADLRQWEQAERFFRQIVESGTAAPEMKSKAYFRLGTISADRGQQLEAIGQYEEALQLTAGEQEGNGQVYRILSAMGTAYREGGQFERAQELLEQSLQLAESARDIAELATTHNSLGTLYARLGDATRAVEAYNRSLSFLEQKNDRLRAAQVYNNLGTIYADQRDWQQAERQYLRSLEVSRAGGDTWSQAKTLNNLMRIYQVLKQSDKTVDVCRRAIGLFTDLHDFKNAALAQRNLGRFYRATRQPDLARREFEQAIVLFARCAEEKEVAGTRRELHGLDENEGLPWWVWTSLILISLLMLVFIAVFIKAL